MRCIRQNATPANASEFGGYNDSIYNTTGETQYDTVADNLLYVTIEQILYSKVIPVICCLGIVGNFLNLVILTRKSLKKSMDRMERSSHCGLIALAVSDLLFCISLLPMTFVSFHQFTDNYISPSLIYRSYHDALINTFITTSTWLTVAMAFSRYLGICHPLKARQVIGMKFAKLSIVCVFVTSILFNLPRYWTFEIMCSETVGEDSLGASSTTLYFRGHGWLKRNRTSYKTFMSAYFIFSIMGPLVILSYCNVYLIKALRKSMQMRKECCRSSEIHNRSSEAANNVTLTLAVIVVCNIILMTPAEIFNFFDDVVIEKVLMTDLYNMVVAIANCLQAINFAFNFLLYLSISASFRHAAKGILLCQSVTPEGIRAYESMTALTHIKTTSVRSSVSQSVNGSSCLKATTSNSKQGICLLSTTV